MRARYRDVFEKHLSGVQIFDNGRQMQAWCPFHRDKGSSQRGLNVDIVRGVYYCFSCGATGSAEQFLERLNLPKHELEPEYDRLATLADELRAEVKELDPTEMSYPSGFKFLTGNETSLVGRKALEYITNERGLPIEKVISHRIGYTYKGPYKGRIIIPTLDEDGNVLYFVGRSYLFNDVPYKNPSTGEAYRGKTEILYNYCTAKTKQQIVVVEGVFDAISVGPHAVACFGKSLSSTQQRLLRQTKAKEFVIALDGDAYNEALEIARGLAGYGREVRVARLPEGEDPDSLDRKELSGYIREAKSVTLSDLVKSKMER